LWGNEDDLTRLCGSCGKWLHDSDRFCDRCGAVLSTGSSQPYQGPAESAPETKSDSPRASLVEKIGELEAKLSESVPRQEIDRLHVRLRQVESLLAESVPIREAKAEADSLRASVAELKDRLARSVTKAELETKVNELESTRKTIEDLREQLSRSSAKIEELQNKLSDSVPRSEVETIKSTLESDVADLRAKLAVSIPRSEVEEVRTTARLTPRSFQISQKPGRTKCPLCKYKNRPDAIYCASCGHKLEDEEKESNSSESEVERSSREAMAKTAPVGGLSKLRSLLWSRLESQKNKNRPRRKRRSTKVRRRSTARM
jgi:hypothetical protein